MAEEGVDNSKKTNTTMSYKGKKVFKNLDRQCPEARLHIKEKEVRYRETFLSLTKEELLSLE